MRAIAIAAALAAALAGCSDGAPDPPVPDTAPPDAAAVDGCAGPRCALPPCVHHYREGHGDLYTSWTAGGGLALTLRAALEPDGVERAYAPLDVCIHVPRRAYDEVVALGGRPRGAGWDPIGVPAGAAFWLLPEQPLDGIPWLGVASDESAAGGVPAGTLETTLTVSVEVDPPPPAGGAFAAWGAVDDPDHPPFLFSTQTGAAAAGFIASSHAHLSWSFGAPGEYLVRARVAGVVAATGAPVASPPATYRFVVEE